MNDTIDKKLPINQIPQKHSVPVCSGRKRKRKSGIFAKSRKRVRVQQPPLITTSEECCFCHRGDEKPLGRFFVNKEHSIAAHQFCLFFSAGLPQRGEDEEGFDGFLFPDIIKEARRSSIITCRICNKNGANVGCNKKSCREVFHVKCAMDVGYQFRFIDPFDSYCLLHRTWQNLLFSEEMECPICLDSIHVKEGVLKAPCCKNVYIHKSCVQLQADTSGYFFRCPTCNNKELFTEEMSSYGVFVPMRDAAWENGNAFSELLEEYKKCDLAVCKCHRGRTYCTQSGKWNIIRCHLCGQSGVHIFCLGRSYIPGIGYVCTDCNSVMKIAKKAIQLKRNNMESRLQEHRRLLNQLKARDDRVLLASPIYANPMLLRKFNISPCQVQISSLDVENFVFKKNSKRILSHPYFINAPNGVTVPERVPFVARKFLCSQNKFLVHEKTTCSKKLIVDQGKDAESFQKFEGGNIEKKSSHNDKSNHKAKDDKSLTFKGKIATQEIQSKKNIVNKAKSKNVNNQIKRSLSDKSNIVIPKNQGNKNLTDKTKSVNSRRQSNRQSSDGNNQTPSNNQVKKRKNKQASKNQIKRTLSRRYIESNELIEVDSVENAAPKKVEEKIIRDCLSSSIKLGKYTRILKVNHKQKTADREKCKDTNTLCNVLQEVCSNTDRCSQESQMEKKILNKIKNKQKALDILLTFKHKSLIFEESQMSLLVGKLYEDFMDFTAVETKTMNETIKPLGHCYVPCIDLNCKLNHEYISGETHQKGTQEFCSYVSCYIFELSEGQDLGALQQSDHDIVLNYAKDLATKTTEFQIKESACDSLDSIHIIIIFETSNRKDLNNTPATETKENSFNQVSENSDNLAKANVEKKLGRCSIFLGYDECFMLPPILIEKNNCISFQKKPFIHREKSVYFDKPAFRGHEKCRNFLNSHLLNRHYIHPGEWLEVKMNRYIEDNLPMEIIWF